MYSPPLLEGQNAHFHAVSIAIAEARARLSGVNHIPTELESLLQSCCVIDKAVEKEAQPSASGASIMYAGYPYDPYA
jgi:hypothetical protein